MESQFIESTVSRSTYEIPINLNSDITDSNAALFTSIAAESIQSEESDTSAIAEPAVNNLTSVPKRKIMSMSNIAQIREILDQKGIEYSISSTYETLQNLLKSKPLKCNEPFSDFNRNNEESMSSDSDESNNKTITKLKKTIETLELKKKIKELELDIGEPDNTPQKQYLKLNRSQLEAPINQLQLEAPPNRPQLEAPPNRPLLEAPPNQPQLGEPDERNVDIQPYRLSLSEMQLVIPEFSGDDEYAIEKWIEDVQAQTATPFWTYELRFFLFSTHSYWISLEHFPDEPCAYVGRFTTSAY